MPVDTQEMKAVEDMKAAVLQVQSPMRRLEDTLSPWSALFIIPVFALANAGINMVSSSYGPGLPGAAGDDGPVPGPNPLRGYLSQEQ